jgi:hypothetical protein
MLQDVGECRILKRSQCDLNLSCYGQIKLIISGMREIFLYYVPVPSYVVCICITTWQSVA